MVEIVQIEIYVRNENCNLIITSIFTKFTQELGSTSRTLLFSLIHPVAEENI